MRHALFPIALLALSACGPKVHVEMAWVEPSITPAPLTTVMVVGIARNAGGRDRFETIATDGFTEAGASALRSIDLMTPMVAITKETVTAAIEGRNIEAIFTTRLLDVETSQKYVPPSYTSMGTYPSYYGSFYGYAPYASNMAMTPGYFVEQKQYLVESSLWEVESGKLMWTAQTSVLDPNKPEPALKNLMKKLMEELTAAGFLGLELKG